MKTVNYLILLLATALPLSAEGIHENFDNVPANTALSSNSVPNWRQEGSAPEGSASISDEAGQLSGKGLRLYKTGTGALYETGGPLWSDTDGAFIFKLNFRFGGKMPFDITLHNGRTSTGFYITINTRTGEMALSQGGGESVFRGEVQKLSVKELRPGTWYTLEIRNAVLRKDKTEPATGKVYLYEAENSADLIVDGISIASSGSIPFSSFKTLLIRRWGEGPLDVDNITLEVAASH